MNAPTTTPAPTPTPSAQPAPPTPPTPTPPAQPAPPQRFSLIGLREVLVFLRPYIVLRIPLVVLASVAMLMAAASTLTVPVVVRQAIDAGLAAGNVSALDRVQVLLIIIAVVLGVSSAVRYYAVTMLGQRVIADMRHKLMCHVLQQPAEFLERVGTGVLLSRLNADIAVVRSVLSSTVSVALRSLLMMVGALAMMFASSVSLSLIALVAVPLGLLPITLLGRRVRGLSQEAQAHLARSNQLVHERVGALQTVQSYCREPNTADEFATTLGRSVAATMRMARLRAVLTTLVVLIAFAMLILLIRMGGGQIVAGDITGGEFGQFMLYTWVVIFSSLYLSEVTGELMLAVGAMRGFIALLRDNEIPEGSRIFAAQQDEPSRLEDFHQLEHRLDSLSQVDSAVFCGGIEFERVSFSYSSRPSHRALSAVSFAVEPGQKLAIVGVSGAGKSTIFHLLLSFARAQRGNIYIGGCDLRAISPRQLRQNIAVVLQDGALFSTSIAQNIRFGRAQASEDEVIAAAQAAGAHEFIAELPSGYDTVIGEGGTTLSGGQRQRLMIARAFVRDAPILLMDEATSALDPHNELMVRLAMLRLMKQRTAIVISHRLSTVREMDKILLLKAGRVVSCGDHLSLYAQNSTYRRFVDLQLEGDSSEEGRV